MLDSDLPTHPVAYQQLEQRAQQAYETVKHEGGFYLVEKLGEKEQQSEWKWHVSVAHDQVQVAYDLLVPFLYADEGLLSFKVLDIAAYDAESEARRDPRVHNSAQITLYFRKMKGASIDIVAQRQRFLAHMSTLLQKKGIVPGTKPDSDAATIYPYFSLRNDGSAIQYLYGHLVGGNYNPFLDPNPYAEITQAPNITTPAQVYQACNRNTLVEVVFAMRIACTAVLNQFVDLKRMLQSLPDVSQQSVFGHTNQARPDTQLFAHLHDQAYARPGVTLNKHLLPELASIFFVWYDFVNQGEYLQSKLLSRGSSTGMFEDWSVKMKALLALTFMPQQFGAIAMMAELCEQVQRDCRHLKVKLDPNKTWSEVNSCRAKRHYAVSEILSQDYSYDLTSAPPPVQRKYLQHLVASIEYETEQTDINSALQELCLHMESLGISVQSQVNGFKRVRLKV